MNVSYCIYFLSENVGMITMCIVQHEDFKG